MLAVTFNGNRNTPGIWGRLRSRQGTSRSGFFPGLGKQTSERRLYTRETIHVYSY
jgi:hypothetical protein